MGSTVFLDDFSGDEPVVVVHGGLSQHGLSGKCPMLVHHRHIVASIACNRKALSLLCPASVVAG